MYVVNSGGVQPCDTFLSTRKAPISISGTHVRQSARTSLDRPARSLGRGPGSGAGSGARATRRPGRRTPDRPVPRHRSAPASALAARGDPESRPGRYPDPVRCV